MRINNMAGNASIILKQGAEMTNLMHDKRKAKREEIRVQVKCRALSSLQTQERCAEMVTQDVHSRGLGLKWSAAGAERCAVCASRLQICNVHAYPEQLFLSAIKEGGWIEISGLQKVPGWETGMEVLAKVLWFSTDSDRHHFRAGLEFRKEQNRVRNEPDEIGPFKLKLGPNGEISLTTVPKSRSGKVIIFDSNLADSGMYSIIKGMG